MKIPEDRKPYEVIINGVKKTYEAGATVSDDAAVKELIDNADTFPPEAPETDKPFNIPIPAPGTNVVANPTLAGDEDSLTGIQIGDTKYAVGGGSGDGAFVVNFDRNTGALDKTWKEISTAAKTKPVVIIASKNSQSMQMWTLGVFANSGGYAVMAWRAHDPSTVESVLFVTDSEDGYPAMQEENNGGTT